MPPVGDDPVARRRRAAAAATSSSAAFATSARAARATAKKVFIEIFNPVIVGWKWLRIHTNRDNVVRVRAFAGLWAAALVALPQNKPLNLPAGSLGQFGNEGDLSREGVCRKPRPHVLL